ncbi:TPA: fimbria/pilus periplasmic chaperone [Enterobacter soli]|nr:fimbria/pilus periplasmic chaperone [Enterobacter soli]
MKLNTLACTALLVTASLTAINTAHAAIALDRTRIIFEGGTQAQALSISNQNKTMPYLAQAWVEDDKGNKIENPFMALPPLQRIEAATSSQVKLQLTGTAQLAQDKESLFYFNLREIPPKSNKANTLQIALQTRIKMFFRPASLKLANGDIPQKAITLTREGNHFIVNNPTGYFITIAHAAASEKGEDIAGFSADMVAPKGNMRLSGNTAQLGNHPVLTYINDYGGRPKLIFSCSGNVCKVTDTRIG